MFKWPISISGTSMLAKTENLLITKTEHAVIVHCLLSLYYLFLLFEDLRGYALYLCIESLCLLLCDFLDLSFSQSSCENIFIPLIGRVNEQREWNADVVASTTSSFVVAGCVMLICFVDISISSVTVFQTIPSTLSLPLDCRLSFILC